MFCVRNGCSFPLPVSKRGTLLHSLSPPKGSCTKAKYGEHWATEGLHSTGGCCFGFSAQKFHDRENATRKFHYRALRRKNRTHAHPPSFIRIYAGRNLRGHRPLERLLTGVEEVARGPALRCTAVKIAFPAATFAAHVIPTAGDGLYALRMCMRCEPGPRGPERCRRKHGNDREQCAVVRFFILKRTLLKGAKDEKQEDRTPEREMELVDLCSFPRVRIIMRGTGLRCLWCMPKICPLPSNRS